MPNLPDEGDPVFDLRRVKTRVSPRGKIHILHTEHGTSWTLCGCDLDRPLYSFGWEDNFDDKQPDCQRCIRMAVSWAIRYPFIRVQRETT